MDDRSLAELRALRARAYGPDADIHRDPVALARLQELERPATARPQERPVTVQVDERAADPQADVVDPEAADDPVTAAPQTVARPPDHRTRRRRLVTAWAASLAVAGVVGAGVGAVVAPASAVRGAARYTTLEEDDGFAQPVWMTDSADDVHGYGDFHGLTPVSTTDDWTGTRSDECLSLITTSDLALRAGPGTSGYNVSAPGCASAPFPASVSFTVDRTAPESLRSVFPEGTSLQFVLDGDHVEVFLGDPVATPPA